ncbi:DNA-directed RNA polymerase subunit delta [Hazenella sp. IB182357]|uniref:Probable DNA-directed RNA polymerase subunit delta n=1 Tax=Polycladospora coralii TaxID=2771432 RepID=A0A926NEH2_9BACL|nr:DNA-directed RNA polymerase subunit delta [Polycladospora coralii]MBD1372069.1 DNA-directed RNA polymerase subunit delta [Polycladospora coralii]MBS7530575.1 DNA-directed RNA polymerase subunit delta [Polycladospora coralii]
MSDKLATERTVETAMVDLTYDLLKNKKEPLDFHDIMTQVSKMKQFTKQDVENYISQLYTEMNIDGRFVAVSRTLWGLKEWYALDQTTDSAVAANVKDDYEEEEFEEEEFEEDLDQKSDDLDDDADFEDDSDDLEDDFDSELEEEDEDEDQL